MSMPPGQSELDGALIDAAGRGDADMIALLEAAGAT